LIDSQRDEVPDETWGSFFFGNTELALAQPSPRGTPTAHALGTFRRTRPPEGWLPCTQSALRMADLPDL
jgi:hypothetical protein